MRIKRAKAMDRQQKGKTVKHASKLSAKTHTHAAWMLSICLLGLFACSSLPWSGTPIPRVYIKDFKLNLRGEVRAGKDDAETMLNQMALGLALPQLQLYGNVGTFATRAYVITADPTLLLHTTETIALPSTPADIAREDSLTDTGVVQQETLLKPRRALFFLERVTVSYQIPGYEIPSVTIDINRPFKTNSLVVGPLPVARVEQLTRRYLADPNVASVSGFATLTCDVRDLDPFARHATFKIGQVIPYVFANGSVLFAESQGNAPITNNLGANAFAPLFGSNQSGASGQASASPMASPTPTTTPSAAASPQSEPSPTAAAI